MSKNRIYSYNDVVMITAAKTIAENFKANMADLSQVRSDWTDESANDLIGKIDSVIENVLGTDAQKDLRNATAALIAIDATAKRDLSFFKTQIDDDFKKESAFKSEILNTLGFTKYLKDVQNGSQEAMTLLLAAFKMNMTDSIKNAIVEKGTSPALIDKIMTYANTYAQANVSQELMKQASKNISKEVADELNAIYEQVIGICKKASKYYQYEPLKKEQFTFKKVADNLGKTHKPATELSEA